MFKSTSQFADYVKKTPQCEAAIFYNPLTQKIKLLRCGRVVKFINEKGNMWVNTGERLYKHDTLIGYLNKTM